MNLCRACLSHLITLNLPPGETAVSPKLLGLPPGRPMRVPPGTPLRRVRCACCGQETRVILGKDAREQPCEYCGQSPDRFADL